MKSYRIEHAISALALVALSLCAGIGCAAESESDPADDVAETESEAAASASVDVCAVLFSRVGHEGARTELKRGQYVRPTFTSPIPIGSYVIQPGCSLTYYRSTTKWSYGENKSVANFSLNFNTDDALSCGCSGANKQPIAYFYVGRYYFHNAVPLWDDSAVSASSTIYRVKPSFGDVVTFLDGDNDDGVVSIYQGTANQAISVTGRNGFIVAKRTSTQGSCR